MYSEKQAERKLISVRFVIGASMVLFIIMLVVGKDAVTFATSRRRVKRGEVDSACDNGGTWIEKSKTCACTLGWIGSQCNVWHNHYCYFDNGHRYRGKLSVTRTGTVCQPWTTDNNLRFPLGKDGIGVHNYCRNPDNDENGLWCYVGGEDFIGYCNATRCPDAVKELLSLNRSEISPADDTSAVVQFLFGPLISGICVGVVALLAFVAVAEYARRKKYFSRRKRQGNKPDKGESGSEHEEIEESPKKVEEIREKSEVLPSGGIITVDMDTGAEKVHAFSSKDIARLQGFINTEEGIANHLFPLNIRDKTDLIFSHRPQTDAFEPFQSRDKDTITVEDNNSNQSPFGTTSNASYNESDVENTQLGVKERRRRRRRRKRTNKNNTHSNYESEYRGRSLSNDSRNSGESGVNGIKSVFAGDTKRPKRLDSLKNNEIGVPETRKGRPNETYVHKMAPYKNAHNAETIGSTQPQNLASESNSHGSLSRRKYMGRLGNEKAYLRSNGKQKGSRINEVGDLSGVEEQNTTTGLNSRLEPTTFL